ncbi:MAG: hypothetical protein GY822_00605 [Deltaproteobacteria bacterium]|nr:hypothetical protein [Deltaproteobacteria bacterium]
MIPAKGLSSEGDPHPLCPQKEGRRSMASLSNAFVLAAVGGWDATQIAIARKIHLDDGLGFFQILEERIVSLLQTPASVKELVQATAQEGFSEFDSLRALWSAQLMGTIARG